MIPNEFDFFDCFRCRYCGQFNLKKFMSVCRSLCKSCRRRMINSSPLVVLIKKR